jgi:hypothetical protein
MHITKFIYARFDWNYVQNRPKLSFVKSIPEKQWIPNAV